MHPHCSNSYQRSIKSTVQKWRPLLTNLRKPNSSLNDITQMNWQLQNFDLMSCIATASNISISNIITHITNTIVQVSTMKAIRLRTYCNARHNRYKWNESDTNLHLPLSVFRSYWQGINATQRQNSASCSNYYLYMLQIYYHYKARNGFYCSILVFFRNLVSVMKIATIQLITLHASFPTYSIKSLCFPPLPGFI